MNNLDNPSGCMDLVKRRKSRVLKPLIAVYLVALGIWVASLFGWLWPIVKALVHGVTA